MKKLIQSFLLVLSSYTFTQLPINQAHLPPDEVVKRFYPWYFSCIEKKGQKECLKTKTAKQFVTKFLIKSILEDEELDYDYIMGGNDMEDAKDMIPTIKVKRIAQDKVFYRLLNLKEFQTQNGIFSSKKKMDYGKLIKSELLMHLVRKA